MADDAPAPGTPDWNPVRGGWHHRTGGPPSTDSSFLSYSEYSPAGSVGIFSLPSGVDSLEGRRQVAERDEELIEELELVEEEIERCLEDADPGLDCDAFRAEAHRARALDRNRERAR